MSQSVSLYNLSHHSCQTQNTASHSQHRCDLNSSKTCLEITWMYLPISNLLRLLKQKSTYILIRTCSSVLIKSFTNIS